MLKSRNWTNSIFPRSRVKVVVCDNREVVSDMNRIAPPSTWRVTRVEALPGCWLWVTFADGPTGVVDMSQMLHSKKAGVLTAITDPSLFAQVTLEFGAVTWPGELDLAPDAMHAAIQELGVG
jgi:hypothetical protein